jgi:putative FmdB family regulatory protein
MPIYEYACRDCGHRFEYLKLSQSPAAQCPACQKQNLEQLISLSATSTEATRKSNLIGAQRRASVVQKDKAHEEHKELHDHFD